MHVRSHKCRAKVKGERMTVPFVGEIKMVSFNFPPKGWALCNGQLLPINQNQALFAILGTTYGGDGRTTFGLPDLRGRTPIHLSAQHPLGQLAGAASVTLTANQVGPHSHTLFASAVSASTGTPSNNLIAKKARFGVDLFATPNPAKTVAMSPGAVSPSGTPTPHDNMQPYLTINFVIALQGVFPSQT